MNDKRKSEEEELKDFEGLIYNVVKKWDVRKYKNIDKDDLMQEARIITLLYIREIREINNKERKNKRKLTMYNKDIIAKRINQKISRIIEKEDRTNNAISLIYDESRK